MALQRRFQPHWMTPLMTPSTLRAAARVGRWSVSRLANVGRRTYDLYRRYQSQRGTVQARASLRRGISSGSSTSRRRYSFSQNPAYLRRGYNRFKAGYKSRYKSRLRGTRRRRRGRGVAGNKLMSTIWKHVCTPQTIKETFACNREGILNQRQWYGFECIGQQFILGQCVTRKPVGFLWDANYSSSLTPSLSATGAHKYKLNVDKIIFDMRIQNRSNASMELKCYECVVRDDVSSSSFDRTGTSWAGVFQANMDTGFGAATLSDLGPNQTANPTGYSHSWSHPTFTPYMSGEFVSFFKILKTHKFNLQPNEILPFKVYQRKKQLHGEQLESAMSYEWVRGWTKYLLFSWVGMPVDDGTTANQGKAVCDLFIQCDLTVKFHFEPGVGPLYNLRFSNDANSITSTYSFNSAGFTPVIPASDTLQVQAADQAAPSHP